MMVPSASVGLISAGLYGTVSTVTEASSPTPDSIQQYFLQLGAVGLAIAVGFWLIRRYDARSDMAAAEARKALEAERAAHEVTRQILMECLKMKNGNGS